jgi:hypothetical protein
MRKKDKGFSLIEVIISSLVMMIIIGAMYSALDSQRKELFRMAQKFAIMDLKYLLADLLTNPTMCKRFLEDNGLTSSTFTTASAVIPVKVKIVKDHRILSSLPSHPLVLVDTDSKTINGLRGFRNLEMELGGINKTTTPGGIDFYQANLEIRVTSPNGPLRPIKFERFIATVDSTSTVTCQLFSNLWQDYPRNHIVPIKAGSASNNCEVTTDLNGAPTIKVNNVTNPNGYSEFYKECFVSPNGVSYDGSFTPWD